MHKSHGLLNQVKSIVRSKEEEMGVIKSIGIEYKQVEGPNYLNLGHAVVISVVSLSHFRLPYGGMVIAVKVEF